MIHYIDFNTYKLKNQTKTRIINVNMITRKLFIITNILIQ